MPLVLRSTKGQPLLTSELDGNFTYLENGKVNMTLGTGSAKVPTGTTAQRDATAEAGYFRFNTTTKSFEGYNGTAWGSVGGGATGGGNDAVFWVNDTKITTDYVVPAGKNAGTFGPVGINAGVTVTVPDNAIWTIV